jgi:hypothetical protein
MVRRHGSIPEANMYGRETLAHIAMDAGFINVRHYSIRGYVFPGAARLARAIRDGCVHADDASIILSEQEIVTCAGVETWTDHNDLADFVILAATKPKANG